MPGEKQTRATDSDHDRYLIRQALAGLQAATGLAAVWDARPAQAGGQALLIGPAGAQRQFAARVRHADRFEALTALRNQFAAGETDPPSLLVTTQLSAEAAQHCRNLGLQFVDGAGNAYLDQPGLFVFVCGRRGATTLQAPAQGRALTASALRIQFALLCQPELLHAAYRRVASAAGVALGSVGPSLEDLRARGRIARSGARGELRELVGRERLLQEWVVNFPIRLRPKLNAKRFAAPKGDWWRGADLRDYGACWGGEVAATLLGAPVQPGSAIIYLEAQRERRNLWHLIVDHQLRPDPQGPVEILDRFWHFDDPPSGDQSMPSTAPRLLVHADLMAQGDRAGVQAASWVLQAAPLA